MTNMIKWIKPNGVEVETNDLEANVKAAKEMGWMSLADYKKAKAAKAKAKKDADEAAAKAAKKAE